MDAESFKDWMTRNRITQSQMGMLLGCSVPTVANYRGGRYPVPRAVGIVMATFDNEPEYLSAELQIAVDEQ